MSIESFLLCQHCSRAIESKDELAFVPKTFSFVYLHRDCYSEWSARRSSGKVPFWNYYYAMFSTKQFEDLVRKKKRILMITLPIIGFFVLITAVAVGMIAFISIIPILLIIPIVYRSHQVAERELKRIDRVYAE